jgi:signal transduction histidine kinase
MIKKVQCKLVAIIMGIFVIFICSLSLFSYYATKRTLDTTCETVLNSALHYSTENSALFSQNSTYPVSVVSVDYHNNSKILVNHIYQLSSSEIDELVHTALSSDSKSGTLWDGELRYMRESINITEIRIAFADITTEQNILRQQRTQNFLLAATALLICFFVSVLLAHITVEPIKNTFEMQERFIANASHELKTPLTVILSNAEMLGNSAFDSSPEQQFVRIGFIKSEAQRMKKLIEKMLQLTKYDNTLKSEQSTKVDFSFVVNNSLLTYEPLIYDQGKELVSDVSAGICIKGNPDILSQLINILLDNALKYSDENSRITAKLNTTAKRKVIFSLTSMGTPINPADYQAIFQRFYRIASDKTSGYGLGLSIAHTIVTDLHGKIWVDSDGRSSNTFFVQFDAL